ncbi:MAG: diguanylate cyclase [Syntrophobacterales bacterium]|nr:diguanylate cyclase [Syntrophobacterales bacterium]
MGVLMKKQADEKPLLTGKGKIAARFRNINVELFALAFFLMVIALLATFDHIIKKVSTNYTSNYAISSANALSGHIVKEIGLMAKAAHSRAVIEWFADENNNAKKALAYEELAGIIGGLYSHNLYIGVAKSLHEYRISEDYLDSNRPSATLDKKKQEDSWYFASVESDSDYVLTVGVDHVVHKKRVWLNYRVIQNGVTLGVICTGLEFSHITGELFSQYDSAHLRGLVIDEDGIIHMDSSLLGHEDFRQYELEAKIENEFSDPVFLAAVKSHFDGIKGYFEAVSVPTVAKLSAGPYRYATIAPVRFTNWSVAVLYDSSSLVNMSLFLPVIAIMLVLLIAFALATNAMSSRLIFTPLEQLVRSLARLKENRDEQIYGIERDDEFGTLSNTIQDLFTKANYDALTGVYNRRFMETSLRPTIELLSRSEGLLTVLMADVDYFKHYNDTYGHEKGDLCLKAIAKVMADSVGRTNDFVARYGGEEFAAILPNTDKAGGCAIAQKILENVRTLNIPHAKSPAAEYVTISIGVTTGKVTHMQNWEVYLKRADEAMYASKQNGRNQYTYLDFSEH